MNVSELDTKRFLIFSVDCWNDKGTNTLSSLFSWVKPENLANIYIRADLPTFKGCNNYFQILENDVIKSIFKRKIITGRKVDLVNSDSNNKNLEVEQKRYKKFRRIRPYIGLMIREVLWGMGKWKSKELDEFLDEFNPDYIIYAHEGYIHFNKLVNYSIKKTGAKGYGYFWDDNFTYKQHPFNPFARFYRFFQKRSIKNNLRISSGNFAIAPLTKKEADDVFKIDTTLLTKPILNFAQNDNKMLFKPYKIIYTGNLGIGRLYSLHCLSEALDIIDYDNKGFIVEVYSNTFVSEKEKKKFGPHIHFNGSVPFTDIARIQNKADILLLLEAIRGSQKWVARLSFSTKLVDYLSQGKCILSIAKRDLASMQYLADNNACLVAENKKEIRQIFSSILNDNKQIMTIANNAYELGRKKHNSSVILNRLKDSLLNN